jgi:hypothetical protein
VWVKTLTGLLTMMQTAAVTAALPPIRWFGELGYDFRFEQFDRAERSVDVTEHAGILKLNAATFLVQPYIALVDGGVGIRLRKSEDSDGQTTTGTFLTGDALMRLFPRSPFPFAAFFQRVDTSNDSELRDLDTLTTRYGFEQSYRTRRKGSFLFRYEHFDVDQDSVTRPEDDFLDDTSVELIDKSDLFRFNYTGAFGRHSLLADATGTFTTRNRDREDTDRIFVNMRHRFRPNPTVTTENRLFLTNDNTKSERLDFLRRNYEFNNFTTWRPRTARRLQVNSLLRARFRSTENEGREGINTTALNGNVSANYQWRPRWNLSGNVSASAVDVQDQERVERYFARGRALYTSVVRPLGRFDWQWVAGPEVSVLSDEDGDVESLGLDIGQTLNRTARFSGNASATFNFQQSVTFVEDTEGRSTQRLLHNLSLGWQQRLPQRQQLLRLSASDSRSFGGGGRIGTEESEFQRIALLASVDQRLSRVSSLRGDINIQTTRTVIGRDDDFDDRRFDLDNGFLPSAAISITYNHVLLFGVPRLRFRSNLRFLSDSYLPQIDDPTGPNARDEIIWENRLEYAIGRLRARLIGTYNQGRNDVERKLILLELRRFFGTF